MAQTPFTKYHIWRVSATEKVTVHVFEEWISVVITDLSDQTAQYHIGIDYQIQTHPDLVTTVRSCVLLFECPRNQQGCSAKPQIGPVFGARDQALSTLQYDTSLTSYYRTLFMTKIYYIGVSPHWIRSTDKIAGFWFENFHSSLEEPEATKTL